MLVLVPVVSLKCSYYAVDDARTPLNETFPVTSEIDMYGTADLGRHGCGLERVESLDLVT